MTLEGSITMKMMIQVAKKLYNKKSWFKTFERIEVSEHIGKFKITVSVMRVIE